MGRSTTHKGRNWYKERVIRAGGSGVKMGDLLIYEVNAQIGIITGSESHRPH